MSAVVIPPLPGDAAALWLEDILVSTPVLSNKEFSRLGRVEEHTGLCGQTTASNILICSLLPYVWKALSPIRMKANHHHFHAPMKIQITTNKL